MWEIFVLFIFSIFVLVLSVYLKYKYNIKTIIIILIIIIINIIFYGSIIMIGHINEIKLENEFNELFQLFDKDHPDYGLLRNPNTLTDDEKIIWELYFGDGGRKVGRYIIMPILCMFIIIFTIVTYFIIIKILHKKNV